jgi:hypothetical protein
MPAAFRKRLITQFVGERDRALNQFHVHLHAVINYLTRYGATSADVALTRNDWLSRLVESLNCCRFCNSAGNPLRFDGQKVVYPSGGRPASVRSMPEHGQLVPSLSAARATVFMFAVLTEDHGLQIKLLADGLSPTGRCAFMGHPLEMACRFGLTNTVNRLLSAGTNDSTATLPVYDALRAAIESDSNDIVSLLLASVAGDYNIPKIQYASKLAASHANRQALELLFDLNPMATCQHIIRAASCRRWILRRKIVREDTPVAAD